jgi:pteridine reductase
MTQTKVALVTGSANRRVGWYVADALAGRGYAIVLHSRRAGEPLNSAVDAFRSRGIQAAGFAADLSSDESTRTLIAQVIAEFGRLDVLVNTAGAWEAKKLEDVTAADVRLHFEANTVGTFLSSQHAGLAMVKQPEGGCIVLLGDWAIERPYLNYASYFPSKGAIPAMMRSLAVELGTRNANVRVNCILPGPVMLPPTVPPDERERVIRGTLVHREGKPENIAQAVLSLIDNDFVTGVCLPVDGGRSIFAPDFV